MQDHVRRSFFADFNLELVNGCFVGSGVCQELSIPTGSIFPLGSLGRLIVPPPDISFAHLDPSDDLAANLVDLLGGFVADDRQFTPHRREVVVEMIAFIGQHGLPFGGMPFERMCGRSEMFSEPAFEVLDRAGFEPVGIGFFGNGAIVDAGIDARGVAGQFAAVAVEDRTVRRFR